MESSAAHSLYHEIGDSLSEVKKGKMFGAECFKAPNGKALAMFYKEDMVFKLTGEAYNEAMALDGAALFDPMGGRPMGGWVQLPFHYAEKWPYFAEQALEYVKTIKKK